MFSGVINKECFPVCKPLLTWTDGSYGTKTLWIHHRPKGAGDRVSSRSHGRFGESLLASGIDNTRSDALRSISRVPPKVIGKSADVLSDLATTNSATQQHGNAPFV